jgi:ribosome-associated protein
MREASHGMTTTPSSLTLALTAAKSAAENRGRDIVVLDMRELTAMFDYFVLVTGASRRQLHAISEQISTVLKGEFGERRLSLEGYRDSRWILLDYGSIVVHLFDQPMREFYALEQLWSDARRVELPDWSEQKSSLSA